VALCEPVHSKLKQASLRLDSQEFGPVQCEHRLHSISKSAKKKDCYWLYFVISL
jgi:hypothetical protein